MTRASFGKSLAVLVAGMFGVMLASCAEDKPPRSRVQANVIDKGYFQGEWWFGTKVIDVNYPFEGMTYPGDAAYDLSSGAFTVSRIRWVIDEKYLYAFRSYELVAGANRDASDLATGLPAEGYIGEPVAAYAIQKHFDIRREYNPTTGEEWNVIVENDFDRKWFERQYMRVDWSQNLLVSWMFNGAELYSAAGILKKEPVPMFVQDYSQWEDYYPASWKPQFAFADLEFDRLHGTHFTDDPATENREGDYNPGELYYIGLVSQAIYTPGTVPDPYTGEPVPWCMSVYVDAPICTSNLVTMRSSFMKISPKHEYKPLYYPDRTRFDYFGVFRTERWTFDRIEGDDPGSDWSFGERDFLGYYANRFNIWSDIFDDEGNEIPYEQRDIREIAHHISKETPRWLIRPAFQFMAEWNDVFMWAVRERKNQGVPLRNYLDPRDWFTPPDPAKRDINCWVAAIGENGQPEVLEDPLALRDEDGRLVPITSWDAFAQENRLAMFYDPNYSFTSPDGTSVTPGSECLHRLYVNTCDKPLVAFPPEVRDRIQRFMEENQRSSIEEVTDDELYAIGIECEERGDMRYKLISYLELPGLPFLGVSSIQSDPITGEIICGDSNIGAAVLHRYRTRAGDEIDLTTGEISELEFITGEDVRSYYDYLGYTYSPPEIVVPDWLPLEGGVQTADGVNAQAIHARMQRVMEKAQRLKGPAGKANILSYRKHLLHGTDIERALFDNDDAMAAAGMITKRDENAPRPVDAIINSISPFRGDAVDILHDDMEKFMKFSRNNVQMPTFFIDLSVKNFVERHKDWPRTNLVFKIEQVLYRETLIHEFGHTVNLRHNMRGSADPWNYAEPYFDIVQRYPKPTAGQFDADRDGTLNAEEAANYRAALDEVQRKRELNEEAPVSHWGSIDTWMTSSMMDYTAQWYNRMPFPGFHINSWDKAAIWFSYADFVEVYDNRANRLLRRCKDPSSGNISDCITPDKVAKGEVGRLFWTYYGGGERCSIDRDCPYASAGERAWELKPGQVTQRCKGGVCSNFSDDMLEAYPGERPEFVARSYKFCTDERRTDIGMDDSQCNIFDEGASYREIVKNMRDTYHRKYIFNNFRRFQGRYDFYSYFQSIVGRYFFQPVKIFQDMIHRYHSPTANRTPDLPPDYDYRNDDGPFGFYDQYMASVDLLNFWAEVIAFPSVGVYLRSRHKEVWQQDTERTDVLCHDCLKIELGAGKYVYSRYQRGLNGVQRVEHFGTLYDKLFALQMLMRRDIGYRYFNDEVFWVNFYDVFPEEILQLVRGMVAKDPKAWKPRVISVDHATKRPRYVFPDLYRGDCLPQEGSPSEMASCRPDPTETDLVPLEDWGSFYLGHFALIFALSDLPVYFDTAPQEMLHVYKVGSLFDAQIPPDAVEGEDYVTYTSDLSHQTFLAFQVEDVPGGRGGSIAFDLVKRCKEYQQKLQEWVVCLQDGTPERCGFRGGDGLPTLYEAYHNLLYEKQAYEAFINYAIQLQQEFGISSWMGY